MKQMRTRSRRYLTQPHHMRVEYAVVLSCIFLVWRFLQRFENHNRGMTYAPLARFAGSPIEEKILFKAETLPHIDTASHYASTSRHYPGVTLALPWRGACGSSAGPRLFVCVYVDRRALDRRAFDRLAASAALAPAIYRRFSIGRHHEISRALWISPMRASALALALTCADAAAA